MAAGPALSKRKFAAIDYDNGDKEELDAEDLAACIVPQGVACPLRKDNLPLSPPPKAKPSAAKSAGAAKPKADAPVAKSPAKPKPAAPPVAASPAKRSAPEAEGSPSPKKAFKGTTYNKKTGRCTCQRIRGRAGVCVQLCSCFLAPPTFTQGRRS